MFQKTDTPRWKLNPAQATVPGEPTHAHPSSLQTAPARDSTRAGGKVHLPAGQAAGLGRAAQILQSLEAHCHPPRGLSPLHSPNPSPQPLNTRMSVLLMTLSETHKHISSLESTLWL